MKHIKIYEEFDPSNSIKEDIKDIFIDVTDNYLDVQITDSGKIVISNPNESARSLKDHNFDIYSNIIDSILRLIDYLKQNKLYMNNIIIKKLRLSHVVDSPSSLLADGIRRWVEDDIYVTNVTEEGLFIAKHKRKNDKYLGFGLYYNELFTDPVHKIIIKYSNCL